MVRRSVVPMAARKRVALIAHDNCKSELVDWARYNRGTLSGHELYATGTTGALLAADLDLDVIRFLSGPLGGDQQVGAGIVEEPDRIITLHRRTAHRRDGVEYERG